MFEHARAAQWGGVWTNSRERGLEAGGSRQHILHRGQLKLLTLTTKEIRGNKHFISFSAQNFNANSTSVLWCTSKEQPYSPAALKMSKSGSKELNCSSCPANQPAQGTPYGARRLLGTTLQTATTSMRGGLHLDFKKTHYLHKGLP